MYRPPQADLEALLEALSTAGIDLIVIGGAAAVLHGAPLTTQDLDIVHRRSEANVARLLEFLAQHDAVLRDPTGRELRPTAELLLGTGQLNLMTTLGPLDPFCQLHDGRGYDELLEHTVLFTDGALQLRVIDLPTLIAIKTDAGRDKDRLAIPVLLALLEESRR